VAYLTANRSEGKLNFRIYTLLLMLFLCGKLKLQNSA